jgi:predicted XRE-type DNA-binding protein
MRQPIMDAETRKSLEAAGYRIGDAADFLGLSEEERKLVDLRLEIARSIRSRRIQRRMTQQGLASKLGSSQPRVARMEAGASDVSLDLLVRGLMAVGATLRIASDPEPQNPEPLPSPAGRKPRAGRTG